MPHELLEGLKISGVATIYANSGVDDRFVAFGYYPDYLNDIPEHKVTISNGYEIAHKNIRYSLLDCRDILVDGDNIVSHGIKMMMFAKVFEENP